ncbi:helix-turn-helix domain-containing protein [uncultured Aquimarina sp.]|uniref:helix-turn-helix domain-containing protein n=1 Tax=uncultured Aquimarina sp. TaxID=575652 RepID=UPI002636CE89|nr:helix-turn-helix domain-containing protein [uncultured Aquimarina sp.]
MISKLNKKQKYSLILLLIVLSIQSQTKVHIYHEKPSINVKYTSNPVIIDGVLSEWDEVEEFFFVKAIKNKEDYNIRAKVLWDSTYLYVCFKVRDEYLNEFSSSKKDILWRDDGVEFYISTVPKKAPLNYLSENEYQFSTNIRNQKYPIKGKKIKSNTTVINENRDFDWINDFKAVSNYEGTINNNNDIDCGYTTEIAVKWNTIGVNNPTIGKEFLSDLCVNNRNDFNNYRHIDWANLKIFAQPKRWNKIILADNEGQITTMLRVNYVIYILLFITGILSLIFFIKRQKTIKNMYAAVDIIENKTVINTYSKEIAKQAINIMQKEYHTDIKIDQLAETLHKSPRQIQRILKQETDNTFTENILRIRMEASKDLLLNSGLTISEIAIRVGVQDRTHFSRSFKKYFGKTPSLYRKDGM